MADLAGQVVWITGGGSGIGLACAVEFARRGARVAVSGRRVDRLTEAIAAIQAAGGEGLAIACDVTDIGSCEAAVAEIVRTWGKLDVAVANAGFALAGYVTRLGVADWHRQFDTNLFGVLHTAYAAIPELRKTKGRLALMASIAAYVVPPRTVAYAASKHAVLALGEGLSRELARDGISVTTLCPGYVESEIAQVDNQGQHHPDRPRSISKWTVPADVAAKDMVRAIEARKVVAPITGHGKLIVWMARFFPGLTRRLVAKM